MYHCDMSRFNILDHLILSGILFQEAIISADAMLDEDNLSHRKPVLLNLCDLIIN
jgi:hypothetical protein